MQSLVIYPQTYNGEEGEYFQFRPQISCFGWDEVAAKFNFSTSFTDSSITVDYKLVSSDGSADGSDFAFGSVWTGEASLLGGGGTLLNAIDDGLPELPEHYLFVADPESVHLVIKDISLVTKIDLKGVDAINSFLQGLNSSFEATLGDLSGTISDLPGNTAPTDLSLNPATVPENVVPLSVVGSFSTVDAEGGSFNYSLVAGDGADDNGSFAIENDQLKINIKPDFETKRSYNIRVKTTDPGGLSYEKPLTIEITNVNEAPDAINDSGFTGRIGVEKAIPITALLSNDTDPDAGDTKTITNVTSANGSVRIDSGNILFTPNISGTATFSYILSDQAGLKDEATVTVVVGKTINGSKGKDYLPGTEGDDLINGLSGDDNTIGGLGDDLLNGGKGADLQTGNAGKDTFVLAQKAGGDIITDFENGVDFLGLSGGLSFGQLSISASGSNTLVNVGRETLATLTGVNSTLIDAADFVLV